MTSCILTVIKNEHCYLDEWIQYHLNLGIAHIFIFEDIDSDSHKQITDRYSQVSLYSINDVLNEHYQKEAIILKETRRYNAQHFYYRSILNYIVSNYHYDYAFIIDIDEFITLEDKDSNIYDVLRLYNKYDAFVMQWKCYGANGLVNKPDYTHNGVIDTYISEMSGIIKDYQTGFVKSCYNLNKYKPYYFFNQHHPSISANWCNTDFVRHSYNSTYKHIYIRHYITKSWEEYMWKLKTRGYFWGRTRKVDQFFSINPDMISLKQYLTNDE